MSYPQIANGMSSDERNIRIDALTLAIRERFPTIPVPAVGDVAPHECKECLAIREAFTGRTWNSLKPNELEARFDSLPMLSPSAFKYYLPAYLNRSLERFQPDYLVCQFTIYAVAPDEDAKEARFADWWRERLALFEPQQFEVLVQFVDLARLHQAFRNFIPSLEHANERLQRYHAHSRPEH
jgi:hypothetical protein